MKAFINNIIASIGIFFSKAKLFLEKYVKPSVELMAQVKSYIDNPVADVLVAITPTGIDDLLLVKLREAFEKAVEILAINDECNTQPTLEQKVQCYINHINTLSPKMQEAAIFKTATIIATLLAQAADEQKVLDKLTDSDIDFLTQLGVKKLKLQIAD